MNYFVKETTFSNENIAATVNEMATAYINAPGKKPLSEKEFKIVLEELFLNYRKYYGEDTVCTVYGIKERKKFSVEISSFGERFDWMPMEEDLMISYNILKKYASYPRYLYSHIGNGKNRVIWEMPAVQRKNSMITDILAATVLAIIGGIIITYLPQATRDLLVKEIITPIFTKCINIISALATPLVFFSVIGGIVGIGDVKAFGKIGSKVLTRMAFSYLTAMVVTVIGAIVAYGIANETTASNGTSAIGNILQMVLDIIPDNLVAPFSIDNDLQVITISIFIGVVMLILGNKLPRLNELVNECSDLVNKMIIICCKLLPLIVFMGVLNIICSSNTKQFASMGKMFLLFIVLAVLIVIIMLIRTSIVTKTSLLKIVPKQMSTLLINITTSSQVTALPENMKCCKKGFGIDEKLVDFALPLGIVIYMPCGAAYLSIIALGMSAAFGVSITLSLILRIVIICTILAIAAPPIPGSTFVVLPVLFTACSVPDEAFALAVIFGTIVGYLLPAFNGFCIQLELLMTAKKLGQNVPTEIKE